MDTFQVLSLSACWSRVGTLYFRSSHGELFKVSHQRAGMIKNALNDKLSFHLRQSISLQPSISSWAPSQSFPPFLGVGFEQFRSLTCFPLPHHLSHSDHSSHSLHPPSPGKPGSRKAEREEERVKQICRN